MGGIYAIINSLNCHSYIGSSSNIDRRFKNHRSQLRRGVHTNRHLQNAWNKYGEAIFEFVILQKVQASELLKEEQKLLDLGPEYNMVTSARGPNQGRTWSSEVRTRVSTGLYSFYSKNPSPIKGRPKSELSKMKNSVTHQKAIHCTDILTGVIQTFSTTTEAAITTGHNLGSIYWSVSNKKPIKGLLWSR